MNSKILMTELLEKYKDCDTFSLTGTIQNVIITNEDKNNALEEIKNKNKKYLLEYYNKFKNEYSLIPFEELYKDIEEETINFGITQKENYMKQYHFFRNSFICDHIGKDTKYSTPKEYFWNFYHSIGLNQDRESYANDLVKNNNKLTPIDKIKNETLKSNLIRYEILFHNHCTESGGLMINYYFKLNKETKEWLLQFESDFDLQENLDDLAFYKNNKIVFSSCTHEKFNTLIR